MIRAYFAFMILDQGQVTSTAKKTGFDCSVEGCNKHFKARRDLDRHIAHKLAEVSTSLSPQQRKSYKCDASLVALASS